MSSYDHEDHDEGLGVLPALVLSIPISLVLWAGIITLARAGYRAAAEKAHHVPRHRLREPNGLSQPHRRPYSAG